MSLEILIIGAQKKKYTYIQLFAQKRTFFVLVNVLLIIWFLGWRIKHLKNAALRDKIIIIVRG